MVSVGELRAFDALESKGAFSLSAGLAAARPTYALELPEEPEEPGVPVLGTFTVTADKANKAVTITGEGYSPGHSVPIMLAYNREPSPSSSDYIGSAIPDSQGSFVFTVPASVTGSAPWLGGESYFASVGSIVEQVPIYTTSVKINAGLRTNIQFKKTLQLSYEIDGVAYEFSSSNNAVAGVSQSGLVTANRVGTAAITLRATDGSGLTNSIMVNVST